jgi:hypothetical protein
MFQRQSRFNALLDLMEGEAEFTPPARRSVDWMECVLRGNSATNPDQFLGEEGDEQFPV